MTSSPEFPPIQDDGPDVPSLEQCQSQLNTPDLASDQRLQLLFYQGWQRLQAGQIEAAIATYDQILQLCPDHPQAHYRRGMALAEMGQYRAAIATYDRAIQVSPQPRADLWCGKGHAQRHQDHYRQALASYDQALAYTPDYAPALAGRGLALAMLGRRAKALANCDRALQRQPDLDTLWVDRGVVHLLAGRRALALADFERALALNPTAGRAWCNRGIVLLRMGLEAAAANSFEQGLQLEPNPHAVWRATAWMGLSYAQMRLGQFNQAIASCDRALALQPRAYAAVLYKFISLTMTGRIGSYAIQAKSRAAFWYELGVIVAALKYQLMATVILLAGLAYGGDTWLGPLRQGLSALLSIGIIVLLVLDVWRHKARLHVVWQTYLQPGWLTYLRAIAIVTTTLTTYTIADYYAPPFLRWGWANLVFGQPGNIMFQPFNLVEAWPLPLTAALSHGAQLLGMVQLQPWPWAGQLQTLAQFLPGLSVINYASLFIFSFWLLLLLGIPFWARLEERIFRRGANTWKQICLRSTQFGLAHLLAGIPLLGGLVLIVPGFLFACRYKYVHDRCLRQTQNPLQAEEAGVLASTADHAVYNAILVTLVTLTLILLQ